MSFSRTKSLREQIAATRSVRSFAQHFLLKSMAGQKLFLHSPRLPRVINISFHEKTCMFSCKMCPYVESSVRDHYQPGSFMTFDTLKHIVASVPNDSYHSFDMSDIGETLAFKPLPDFVRYMKDTRPLVNTIISTNGLLLTEDRFVQLARSGLDSIQVSLFAENAADHEMITGSRGFAVVKKNIEAVCRLKREMRLRKPFIQTFMIECKENSHTSQRFLDYWSGIVDHAFIRPMYNVGRRIEGMTAAFAAPVAPRRYPCITPWYSTAIRSNGDVLGCYMFHWHKETWDASVGNINAHTLEDIWRSPSFRQFREQHLALQFEELPVCRACDLWSGYTNVWREGKGTYAYAPVRLGDFFRPSPPHRGG